MNVLDVGCGTGGLSLIAWKMVGHTGSVTEVDRDETTLGTARALPGDLGQRAVAIVSGALGTAQFPAAFDAVVGRLLLAYPNDPPTLVRQAAAFVRPAGSVDFLALDFSARGSTWPQADEIESSGSAAGPNKTFSARTLRVNSRSARAFETGARIS
jgi:ubiquinone/menaquinone biosynthesis C-methylase UbiE